MSSPRTMTEAQQQALARAVADYQDDWQQLAETVGVCLEQAELIAPTERERSPLEHWLTRVEAARMSA